jgi:PmbA protein
MRAGSFPVDAEGFAGADKAVVKNGRLEAFLFDGLNAAHFKTVSTGNCRRAGFKAMPEPGVSNFYIPSGKTNRQEALSKFSGIYADSLMGLHTANPVSGNFSLGASGWLYEKGKIIKPVKEVLIAGNIKDIMKKVKAVCDDLEFFFNLGAPTVIIGGINVAGKE